MHKGKTGEFAEADPACGSMRVKRNGACTVCGLRDYFGL